MDMKLEKLKQELKQKNKELDEYIEKHENYLSDEAEAIRKEIYRIADEINRIEKSQENNEEDKLKDFIKLYEEVKAQSFIIESINKDFFFEFADCLIEIIKELEAKLEFKQRGDLDNTQFEEYMSQFVPKQKVKDIINENGFEVYTREYGNVEVVSIEVLEELLEEK